MLQVWSRLRRCEEKVMTLRKTLLLCEAGKGSDDEQKWQ